MKAQSYLEVARNKFSASFLSDYPTTPYLMSSFYSQSFDVNMVANPIGEVCPVHAKDFSSMRDKDYDKWADVEKNVIFKYWMKSEFGSDFTNVKDNCIYFQSNCYVIRTDKNRPDTGVRLPLPQTLDDFISDCNRVGVELYWKEEVIKKHFK